MCRSCRFWCSSTGFARHRRMQPGLLALKVGSGQCAAPRTQPCQCSDCRTWTRGSCLLCKGSCRQLDCQGQAVRQLVLSRLEKRLMVSHTKRHPRVPEEKAGHRTQSSGILCASWPVREWAPRTACLMHMPTAGPEGKLAAACARVAVARFVEKASQSRGRAKGLL